MRDNIKVFVKAFAEGFLGRLLIVHARQQPLQRHGAQLADRQAERMGAGTDRCITQTAVAGLLQDLPDRLPIEPRNASEIFLVPATLFHQASDFDRQVSAGQLYRCGHGADRTVYARL